MARERDDAGRRPLRVVYLDHVARMSGGEIALLRLLPALPPHVQPLVLLGEDGPLVGKLRDAGVEVEVLPMATRLRDVRKDTLQPRGFGVRPLLDLVRYVVRLRRRLRQLRPDLVHTNSLKAAMYGGVAGRLAGIPVVWHVRDRIADDYLPASAVRLVHLASRLLPTAIVANSQATLATLPASARGSVLYNPVVPDIVSADWQPPALGDGTLRVGVVGRLAHWKGQHVFLDAFAAAFPDEPTQAHLVGSAMFGEEEYALSLREQAARLGIADRVQWRGFREDVAGELAGLDVLVHCSVTAEPFGQVVVEGMAAGLPVVAAAAGGPLEIIEDGVDGLLTPPGDVDALAGALRRLAAEPELRRRLGERARESSRRFSPAAASLRLRRVYAEVLGLPTQEPEMTNGNSVRG